VAHLKSTHALVAYKGVRWTEKYRLLGLPPHTSSDSPSTGMVRQAPESLFFVPRISAGIRAAVNAIEWRPCRMTPQSVALYGYDLSPKVPSSRHSFSKRAGCFIWRKIFLSVAFHGASKT